MTTDLEHYVVEAADTTYHHTPGEANEHRIGLPIVAGPFDTPDEAHEQAAGAWGGEGGHLAVTIPANQVPDDWKDG